MQFSIDDAKEAAAYLAAMIPSGQRTGVLSLSPSADAFVAMLAEAARLPVIKPDRDDTIPDLAVYADLVTVSGRSIRHARRRWGNRPAYVWVRRDAAAATPDLVAKLLLDDKERVVFPNWG